MSSKPLTKEKMFDVVNDRYGNTYAKFLYSDVFSAVKKTIKDVKELYKNNSYHCELDEVCLDDYAVIEIIKNNFPVFKLTNGENTEEDIAIVENGLVRPTPSSVSNRTVYDKLGTHNGSDFCSKCNKEVKR